MVRIHFPPAESPRTLGPSRIPNGVMAHPSALQFSSSPAQGSLAQNVRRLGSSWAHTPRLAATLKEGAAAEDHT
jgi:hypothetical protein